jgi:hypothetical protein
MNPLTAKAQRRQEKRAKKNKYASKGNAPEREILRGALPSSAFLGVSFAPWRLCGEDSRI